MKRQLLYVIALCLSIVPSMVLAKCGGKTGCSKDRHIHRNPHTCHNHHRRNHPCGERTCTRCHNRRNVAEYVDAQESDVAETASDRRARERRERHGRYHDNRHANIHDRGHHDQQLPHYRTLDAERTSGKYSPMHRNAPEGHYWSEQAHHGRSDVDHREHSGGRAARERRQEARDAKNDGHHRHIHNHHDHTHTAKYKKSAPAA